MALPSRNPFLTRAEEGRLRVAIALAERGHRGELRVHLEARYPGDGPVARAAELFSQLGLGETADDTGVLLYVAVRDGKAAVWAGSGIYQHGSARAPDFWKQAVALVAAGFAHHDAAGGIEQALAAIGGLLREVAPGADVHGNELPNEVSQA